MQNHQDFSAGTFLITVRHQKTEKNQLEIVLSAEKIIKEKAVHIGARTVKLLCVLFLVFVIGTLHKCK